MSLRKNFIIIAGMITLGTASAFAAETTETQIQKPPAHHKLTPEQHEAKKAEIKEKLEKMTPEQRTQFKEERRAKWKERYDSATPEQQEKMREHMKERREHHQSMKEAAPAPAK